MSGIMQQSLSDEYLEQRRVVLHEFFQGCAVVDPDAVAAFVTDKNAPAADKAAPADSDTVPQTPPSRASTASVDSTTSVSSAASVAVTPTVDEVMADEVKPNDEDNKVKPNDDVKNAKPVKLTYGNAENARPLLGGLKLLVLYALYSGAVMLLFNPPAQLVELRQSLPALPLVPAELSPLPTSLASLTERLDNARAATADVYASLPDLTASMPSRLINERSSISSSSL